jgi:steroid delta-isomerase-like uncharacterized protein
MIGAPVLVDIAITGVFLYTQQNEGGNKMGVEETKAIGRRYCSTDANEYMKSKETSGGEDVHTPDFVLHSLTGDMKLKDYMALVDMILNAFPDFKYYPEDIIAEGDKVVVRYILTGTHLGDFSGVPASGKRIKNEGIAILRIKDSKVSEAWMAADSLNIMQQIGAIPSQ